jgi:hypothetical protein
MARARTSHSSAFAFDAITVEGALIAPAMLGRVARHEADGQSGADYSVPKGLTLRDEIARYFRIGQALHAEFASSKSPSLNATITFVEKLLHDVLDSTIRVVSASERWATESSPLHSKDYRAECRSLWCRRQMTSTGRASLWQRMRAGARRRRRYRIGSMRAVMPRGASAATDARSASCGRTPA